MQGSWPRVPDSMQLFVPLSKRASSCDSGVASAPLDAHQPAAGLQLEHKTNLSETGLHADHVLGILRLSHPRERHVQPRLLQSTHAPCSQHSSVTCHAHAAMVAGILVPPYTDRACRQSQS